MQDDVRYYHLSVTAARSRPASTMSFPHWRHCPTQHLGALAEPRSTREMVPASSERSLSELGNEQLSAPYRQKAQEEALGAG